MVPVQPGDSYGSPSDAALQPDTSYSSELGGAVQPGDSYGSGQVEPVQTGDSYSSSGPAELDQLSGPLTDLAVQVVPLTGNSLAYESAPLADSSAAAELSHPDSVYDYRNKERT